MHPNSRCPSDSSVRDHYRARIESVLRTTGLPRAEAAILPLLSLLEDAAVRAAGRGAGAALETVADLGRVSEASRLARERELKRWTVNERSPHAAV